MVIVADPKPSLSLDRFDQSWDGRRVVVVGLGRSGQAAAELLSRVGCRVRVTEQRDTAELRTLRTALLHTGIEEVEVGGHTERLMDEVDCVVVSPGVPESIGPIQWALQRHLPILSEIELAFHFCRSPIVAVTGTNGKSTAVTLMAEVLNASGQSAIACGNLGTPFSSVVSQCTPETMAVVEISSFQLLWCEQFRPHIGVLLNVGTNHLDRHRDHAAYLAAKARLFQRQGPGDWAVLNGADPRVVLMGERFRARRVWFGENRSNPSHLRIAPETQRVLTEGVQAVLQVGRLLGIADPLIWQVIRTFRGLEHRLEPVATIRGVHLVNDSKSTTPDSFLFALSQTQGDVIAIVGGRDKGLDFAPLVEGLKTARIKGVVLLGESRSRLRTLLNGSGMVHESHTLDEAVSTALTLAEPGSTILFSPACASFDMFRNFEERGRAFKEIISRMRHAACGMRNGSPHSELRTPNSELASR